jgi:hypothetical protein
LLNSRGKLDQLEGLLDHHFLGKRIITPRQIVISGHEQYGTLRIVGAVAGCVEMA